MLFAHSWQNHQTAGGLMIDPKTKAKIRSRQWPEADFADSLKIFYDSYRSSRFHSRHIRAPQPRKSRTYTQKGRRAVKVSQLRVFW